MFCSPSLFNSSKTFRCCWFSHYWVLSCHFDRAVYWNHTNILINKNLEPFFLMHTVKIALLSFALNFFCLSLLSWIGFWGHSTCLPSQPSSSLAWLTAHFCQNGFPGFSPFSDISAFQITQTGRDFMVNMFGRVVARGLHQRLLALHWALWSPQLWVLVPGGAVGTGVVWHRAGTVWGTHKRLWYLPTVLICPCIVTILVVMMHLAGRQRCRKETFLSSVIYSLWNCCY